MSNEHVCARCPKRFGRSCCEPGEGEHLATLTREDVSRIAETTRRPRSFFVDEEWLTHEEAWNYERIRPLFRGYFARAPVRLTLRRSARGACVFHLRDQGCTLSEETRPLACRLYPFERLADGSWSVAVGQSSEGDASGCLAVDEAHDLAELEVHFGVSLEKLEAWAEQLRTESRLHGRG